MTTRRLLSLAVLAVACATPSQAALLLNTNAVWKLFKGRAEASTPDTTAWRRGNFDDSTFVTAQAGFWYGDLQPIGTELPDMLNAYSSFSLRRTFVITNLADYSTLQLLSRCDDGFIAWINGTEVTRFNMGAGNIAFNGLAPASVAEPVTNRVVNLPAPTSYLALGTNVLAVQVFNNTIGSSDVGFDMTLANGAADGAAPAVLAVSPSPGNVDGLSSVTVTFNEPVLGVDAADLRVNGSPAATVFGGSDTYTFTFPAPSLGTVQITWAGAHGIVDVATPIHAFDAAGPGATWQYTVVDTTPPRVAFQLPFGGVTVRNLTQIEVDFTEAVTGVDAGDLLINNAPATNVVAVSPAVYLFRFPPPAPGPVPVIFSASPGIQDLGNPPNNLVPANWTYIVDPNAVLSSVRLNELVAVNVNGLRDEDNEPNDWVELFNTSSNAVSLAGWALSDEQDTADKWIFPPVAIPARGYLLVFCSGKDRRPLTPGSRLHANFKLNPDGEFLGLYNAEVPRQLVSSFNPYPNQRRDYSYGYDATDQLRYFATPTPSSNNPASTLTGVVVDTKFSHDRGFYSTNFFLSITCATPGVTIRYTVNGTAPSASAGILYTGPVPITNTTPVRALASKAGLLPSDVDCHTYLFLEDVIRQSMNGQPAPGWPASWGANTVDYGMDPDIVFSNATYRATIKDDLKAIPTLSLVLFLDDLFSAGTGIYANPNSDGIGWERPCSLELIHPEDAEGFQVNCGLRLRGGFSRSTSNPKHALRVFFRQEYGPSKLNYPVFDPTGARDFDKFDLRTMQNYSWSFQGANNGGASMTCVRDVMSRDAQLAMNGLGTRGNFYHLYINGQYWGLFNTEERPEASFAESYVGGREEDYDVIKVDGAEANYITVATDGNTAAWTRLWRAATNGFASDVDYFRVQGLNLDGASNTNYENLLDVPNLIDYMLIILWGGNLDAPISNFLGNNAPNNWYGFRDRTGLNGGFRFISHDAEHTMLDVNADRNGPYAAGDPAIQGAAQALTKSNPQYIWTRLQANAEFRLAVADRVQKHCFNGGALSVEGLRVIYAARSNELHRAIVAESARWGDAKQATPYTAANWMSAITGGAGFISGRTAVLLGQMRSRNLFPSVTAPTFNAAGGAVSNGFGLLIGNGNPGSTVYYTVNGADPRARGGSVGAGALAYPAGTPVVINFPTTIRARVLSGGTWSAITEATYYPGQDFSKLLVSEIMYHPPDAGIIPGEEFEFLELKNVGAIALDLTEMSFTSGLNFSFAYGTRIAPGQFLVLGRNPAQFAARYPGVPLHGTFTGRLANGGDTLTLTGPLGTTALSVEYKDGGRWPITADGQGFSIVPRNPNANPNPNNPSNWRASTNPGGSPGSDDPVSNLPGLVINEALTHTDLLLTDFIELFNPTGQDVDLGGWFLTDDAADPRKFRIRAGTMITAGGFRVFTETDFNPTPGTNNSFSLEGRGESVYLLSGDANTNLTGYSHGFNFDTAPSGVSFGRHVTSVGDEHFVLQTARTPGAANSGPIIGPVVIRQVMYHPPDLLGGLDNSDDEYIELRNITAGAVPLFDPAGPTNTWHLRGGVGFDFPLNISLAPMSSLLLVNFNPTNLARLAAFRGKYGSFNGVPLFGPYGGKLDNSSDTVEIKRPDVPDTNGVPYFRVDQVDYQDAAPWPSSPDGGGAALQRVSLTAYGDDPGNWVGAAPLTIVGITPASIAVRAGTNVIFAVTAFGTGTLTYQWRKDGLDLSGATNETLALVDVQLEDEGGYSVRVGDVSGSTVSAPAFLYVTITTVMTQPPVSQTVVAGGRVTLSCAINASPPPFTYEWRIVSTPVWTNVTHRKFDFYSFTAPNMATSMNFRVVVKNLANPQPGVSHPAFANVTVLADTDRDGLPDNWETSFGLNPNDPADAALDPDLDGMTNGAEYIAGTDPLDNQSYLKVERPLLNAPATITFHAVSSRTYTVQYKNTLDDAFWFPLADVVARTTNRTESVVDPAPAPQRLYRLATPQTP